MHFYWLKYSLFCRSNSLNNIEICLHLQSFLNVKESSAYGWSHSSRKARVPISRFHSQCYGCRWPGDARSQGISSLDIDLVFRRYSSTGIDIYNGFILEGNHVSFSSLRSLTANVLVQVDFISYRIKGLPRQYAPTSRMRNTYRLACVTIHNNL